MNTDTEPEKLAIEADKIIPILLKHLMVLKNENAFLKNSAAIYSIENGMPNTIYGAIKVPNGIPQKREGIESIRDDIGETREGIESARNDIGRKGEGIESARDDIGRKGEGIENVNNDIRKKGDGINYVSEALQDLSKEANSGVLIYSVFEKALIKALEEYIKSGDGQKTLYSFYTDFVEAMEEQNQAEEKIKEAAKNVRLEDTHILPARIEEGKESIHKLKVVLHDYFSVSATRGMYKRVATELLFLHNEGKATGAQLRELTKLSEPGFRKHIPRLVRTGLIKKQAPLNYVLTENSKRILLELFGIPKKPIRN